MRDRAEIIAESRRRWNNRGLSEKQQKVLEEAGKFIINPGPKQPPYTNKEPGLASRINVDRKREELRRRREEREVWEEPEWLSSRK